MRRRRHQATLCSVLESDGQVSVRVTKAKFEYQTLYFIIFIHWKVTFTSPSLNFSLLKPLLHHNLLLCRLFTYTVFPPFHIFLPKSGVTSQSVFSRRCQSESRLGLSRRQIFTTRLSLLNKSMCLFFGKSTTLKIRVDGGERLCKCNCAESEQREQLNLITCVKATRLTLKQRALLPN